MSVKHECTQGDSFAYDFSSVDVPTLDVNWTGSWAIVPVLGDPATASGTLALSGGNDALELRITPAETEAITVGAYILIVEIANATLGYKKEVMQDKFTIKLQGIPV